MIYCLKKQFTFYIRICTPRARPSTKIVVQPFGYTRKHAHQDDIHKPQIAGQIRRFSAINGTGRRTEQCQYISGYIRSELQFYYYIKVGKSVYSYTC